MGDQMLMLMRLLLLMLVADTFFALCISRCAQRAFFVQATLFHELLLPMALFRLSSMARSPPLLSVEAQESSAPAPGSAAGSRNLPPFFDDPFIKFDFHILW